MTETSTSTIPHLSFTLYDGLYAVAVDRVQEVVELPELIPVAEAPDYIVGVANLRGHIVPVMDFKRRLGYAADTYSTKSFLLVFRLAEEAGGGPLGLIVQQVRDMLAIDPDAIEAMPAYAPREESSKPFVSAMVERDDELIAILNVDNLVLLPQELAHIGDGDSEEEVVAPERSFFPQATPEERETFRQRARALRRPVHVDEVSAEDDLAVIKLNDEYFGIELTLVREIVAIDRITPIPCCPDFVVGAINWRGDALTLIDIHAALDVPPLARDSALYAVVVGIEDLVVGILVEAVLDVVALGKNEAAVASGLKSFVRSTLPFADRMLGVIDAVALFKSGRFEVV